MSQLRRVWPLGVLTAFLMAPAGWSRALLVCAGLAGGARLAWRGARRWIGQTQGPQQAEPGSLVLGAQIGGGTVRLSDHQLSAHGLILGASGSGKTTTLLRILTARIAGGYPVVAIDMKGSPQFRVQLESAARSAGRPFLLWTPGGPSVWNPLAHGNPTELKDKLIASERFTEPHYQRAAERYLQNVLSVLRALDPERPPTLQEVVSLLEPPRLAAVLRQLGGERAAAMQDYLANLTPDALSAVRGLATRLAILTESDTGAFLDRPAIRPGSPLGGEIDLRRALRGEAVVVFSLNASRYGKLAAQLGTLAVQDLVAASGWQLEAGGGPGAGRAVVAIDEFSALGADQVLALLARARESNVAVLVATQELADLDRAAPGLRDQVLGNTALKIAHRQDVPASAQTVAQMAGTEKRWELTEHVRGGGLGAALGSALAGPGPRRPLGGSGGGTRREVEQFLVHPNEIKRLATGEAVVIAKLPRTTVRTVRVTPAQTAPSAARRAPSVGDGRRQTPPPGVTR